MYICKEHYNFNKVRDMFDYHQDVIKYGHNTNLYIYRRLDSSEVVLVELYGHPIMEFYPDHVYLHTCNYNTATTKNIMNKFLALVGIPCKVRQINFMWYLLCKSDIEEGKQVFAANRNIEIWTI